MGYIYKIENRLNGKVYIGQTCGSVKRRWWKHLSDARRFEMPGSILHRAIKKYGEDSFEVTTIEEIPNDMLDEREIYWIEFYGSYRQGYNLTQGGMGHKCIPHEKITELWDQGHTTKEIAAILHCGTTTVGKVLSDYSGYCSFEGIARSLKKHQRRINQFDIDGHFVASFESIVDAYRATHISQAHIVQVCKGTREFAGGFRWRYVEDGNPTIKEKKRPKPRLPQIVQYDLDGNAIKRFDYLVDVENELHIDASRIARCCRCEHDAKTAGGYQWRFITDEPPGKLILASSREKQEVIK